MPVPFTFGQRGDKPTQPEAAPPGNEGQPEADAGRLERLREHTRVAIDDLGRLRMEVEAKTLRRLDMVRGGFTGVPTLVFQFEDAAIVAPSSAHELTDGLPGGWHAVRPETVDAAWEALAPFEVGTFLFTLLERVDELQGVVEWLVDRIEPVLAQAERAIARHAHAPGQPIDVQTLDAQDQATVRRMAVLGAALDLVLAVRLLQADGTLTPGHEEFLEQVRRAAQ
ncbi:hypothetical protein D3C72_1010320 [compost metagenome]